MTEQMQIDSGGPQTRWKCIIVAGVVCFLSAVENAFVFLADWPYMSKMDSDATIRFYGSATSLSTAAHVVAAVFFSLWTYKTHRVRPQIIFGRILAFVSCCIYLCVEYLPTHRRYLIMFCYALFSVAGSSASILRVYLVLSSSNEDRSRAFAGVSAAQTVSIIVGPLVQVAFSWISYPGIEIFPKMYFHLYSAPIWIAAFTNIVTIIFVQKFLDEIPPREEKSSQLKYSLSSLQTKYKQVKEMQVPWSMVIFCLLIKVLLNFTPDTVGTLYTPLMMSTFGWSNEYIVFQSSLLLVVIGTCSFCVGTIFMGTSISNRIHPRTTFLAALLLSVSLYVISYPYPGVGQHPISSYNKTLEGGCKPEEYSWCADVTATHPLLFLPILVIVMGIGSPMGAISIDTLYSKLLGACDQTIMQGLIVVVQDLAYIVEPVYATTCFTLFGQAILWKINLTVVLIGLFFWVKNFSRLKDI